MKIARVVSLYQGQGQMTSAAKNRPQTESTGTFTAASKHPNHSTGTFNRHSKTTTKTIASVAVKFFVFKDLPYKFYHSVVDNVLCQVLCSFFLNQEGRKIYFY